MDALQLKDTSHFLSKKVQRPEQNNNTTDLRWQNPSRIINAIHFVTLVFLYLMN